MVPGSQISTASDSVDSLGCPLGKLKDDQQILGAGIKFYQKSSHDPALGRVETPATNRGFLIGLSIKAGHRRRVFSQHHATTHDFAENAVYVRDFSESYRADLGGAFHFMLMEITPASLAQIAEGAETPTVTRLRSVSEEPDPVLRGLTGALFSKANGQLHRSALFVDQLSIAIGIHLLQKYGDGRAVPTDSVPALSRRREKLAKDLLQSRMDGDVSIDEVASACNLSRGTFLRSFRETTGKTPHQWLTQQRVEKARALLLDSTMPLSEVASACGFSDQSHFTRVFSVATGATPGVWRRSRLS